MALSLPLAASGSPIVPQLNAKVNARTISLTNASGARVRVLQRNSYRFVVRDATRAQNFHLVGPGVNLKTTVAATTRKAWTVELRPGIYV